MRSAILVGSHKNAPVALCPVQDLVVGHSGDKFRDVFDVVPLVSEALDDPRFDTLVSEEVHATDLGGGG